MPKIGGIFYADWPSSPVQCAGSGRKNGRNNAFSLVKPRNVPARPVRNCCRPGRIRSSGSIRIALLVASSNYRRSKLDKPQFQGVAEFHLTIFGGVTSRCVCYRATSIADCRARSLEVEPAVRIELTTHGLQNRCSTAELSWRLHSQYLLLCPVSCQAWWSQTIFIIQARMAVTTSFSC